MLDVTDWIPVAVLPNVFTRQTVEGEIVALVPVTDARLKVFIAAHPGGLRWPNIRRRWSPRRRRRRNSAANRPDLRASRRQRGRRPYLFSGCAGFGPGS